MNRRKHYNYQYLVTYKLAGVYEYSMVIVSHILIKPKHKKGVEEFIRVKADTKGFKPEVSIDITSIQLVRKFRVG